MVASNKSMGEHFPAPFFGPPLIFSLRGIYYSSLLLNMNKGTNHANYCSKEQRIPLSREPLQYIVHYSTAQQHCSLVTALHQYSIPPPLHQSAQQLPVNGLTALPQIIYSCRQYLLRKMLSFLRVGCKILNLTLAKFKLNF